MDKNMKYVVLAAVGGVGVYLLWKGNYLQQWFPSLFGGDLKNPTLCKTATLAELAAAGIGDFASLLKELPAKGSDVYTWTGKIWSAPGFTGTCGATAPTVTMPKTIAPGPTTPVSNCPPAGTVSVINGITQQADGKCGWHLLTPPNPQPTACPPGQVRVNNADPTSACVDPTRAAPNYCDSNTPGWSYQNGQCAPTPPAVQSISDKMTLAAGQSDGLNMDQWCYYYTQVTGNDCPRDPGDIIAAAGDNPPSFPDGRATVMDIGTWMAFMNQDGAGLTGIEGLAALHVANAWLV